MILLLFWLYLLNAQNCYANFVIFFGLSIIFSSFFDFINSKVSQQSKMNYQVVRILPKKFCLLANFVDLLSNKSERMYISLALGRLWRGGNNVAIGHRWLSGQHSLPLQ